MREALASSPSAQPIHSEMQDDDALALRAHGLATPVIQGLDLSPSSNQVADITSPPESAAAVEVAAARTRVFPDPGRVICYSGIAALTVSDNKMRKIAGNIDEIGQTLSSAIDLQSTLTRLPGDQDSYAISPEIREKAAKLKEMGLDILNDGDQQLSLNKLNLIRSDLEAFLTKQNTLVRNESSKLQTESTRNATLIEAIKTVLKLVNRLIDIINSNSKKQ